MKTLLPILINWLQLYGYPPLWITVFIAAIGLPLPISLLLLALGAFASLGDFNLILLALTTISASVAGDTTGYLIGRKIGPVLLVWLKKPRKRQIISGHILDRSQKYFHQRGAWAIFLSRCLVPALGGSINLLAGIERYPYQKFLLFDAAGETLGCLLPLLLGYTFGAGWEAIGDLLNTTSTLILALLIAIYLTFLLLKTLHRMKIQNEQQQKKGVDNLQLKKSTSTKLTFSSQTGAHDQEPPEKDFILPL